MNFWENNICNGGHSASNEGAINCFVPAADYINIVYRGDGASLKLTELFVYTQIDYAQIGSSADFD